VQIALREIAEDDLSGAMIIEQAHVDVCSELADLRDKCAGLEESLKFMTAQRDIWMNDERARCADAAYYRAKCAAMEELLANATPMGIDKKDKNGKLLGSLCRICIPREYRKGRE
jgi:hypothetical protein